MDGMPKTWRILSIDGGGARGIIPAIILATIEEYTHKPISQLFDLIAGTSTGAILALALTKPDARGESQFSAQDLCKLYEREIPNIFRHPQSWWGNLLSPKYNSQAFDRVLKAEFGSCRLKDAITDVLVPCYDIERRSPYTFKSRAAKWQNRHDFSMREVALAASASPTLFRPVWLNRPIGAGKMCLVDGGVCCNNPTISAYSEIKSLNPAADDEYLVVSIGTGRSARPLTEEFFSLWGYVHWSRPMLELVMESISESTHEQMKHILPASHNNHQPYYRLQVDLADNIEPALDCASIANVRGLTDAAEDFCSDLQRGIEIKRLSDTLLSLSEQQRSQPALSAS